MAHQQRHDAARELLGEPTAETATVALIDALRRTRGAQTHAPARELRGLNRTLIEALPWTRRSETFATAILELAAASNTKERGYSTSYATSAAITADPSRAWPYAERLGLSFAAHAAGWMPGSERFFEQLLESDDLDLRLRGAVRLMDCDAHRRSHGERPRAGVPGLCAMVGLLAALQAAGHVVAPLLARLHDQISIHDGAAFRCATVADWLHELDRLGLPPLKMELPSAAAKTPTLGRYWEPVPEPRPFALSLAEGAAFEAEEAAMIAKLSARRG